MMQNLDPQVQALAFIFDCFPHFNQISTLKLRVVKSSDGSVNKSSQSEEENPVLRFPQQVVRALWCEE